MRFLLVITQNKNSRKFNFTKNVQKFMKSNCLNRRYLLFGI